eukprot:SAG31_NODE_4121_length_3562_cov_5.914525_4_plen_87_part_00
MIDADGNKELTKTEIVNALKDKKEIRELLGLKDNSWNGGGLAEAAFEAAFEKMDSDKSGTISEAEFTKVVKQTLGQNRVKSRAYLA